MVSQHRLSPNADFLSAEGKIVLNSKMLFVAFATFAAGCNTQAPEQVSSSDHKGPAGPAGYGLTGPQGATGWSNSPGVIGVVRNWTIYGHVGFDGNSTAMRNSEYQQVSDVTTYVQRNPSLLVGLDNSTSPGTLGQRRAEAIRDAQTNSVTLAEKIQITAFNEPLPKQNNQVGVLFISAQ